MYRSLCSVVVLWLVAQGVEAHPADTIFDNFSQGALHPLTGIDHTLALIIVGVLASRTGGGRQWRLPLLFTALLLLGGWLGLRHVPLPATEPVIAASIIVGALWVLLPIRQLGAIRLAVVGLFALAHGYAHGAEMSPESIPLWYGLGFVLASVVLLLSGWLLGGLAERHQFNVRPVMMAIAGAGVYWLLGS